MKIISDDFDFIGRLKPIILFKLCCIWGGVCEQIHIIRQKKAQIDSFRKTIMNHKYLVRKTFILARQNFYSRHHQISNNISDETLIVQQ